MNTEVEQAPWIRGLAVALTFAWLGAGALAPLGLVLGWAAGSEPEGFLAFAILCIGMAGASAQLGLPGKPLAYRASVGLALMTGCLLLLNGWTTNLPLMGFGLVVLLVTLAAMFAVALGFFGPSGSETH